MPPARPVQDAAGDSLTKTHKIAALKRFNVPVPDILPAYQTIQRVAWWFAFITPDSPTEESIEEQSVHFTELFDNLPESRGVETTSLPFNASDLSSAFRMVVNSEIHQHHFDYFYCAGPQLTKLFPDMNTSQAPSHAASTASKVLQRPQHLQRYSPNGSTPRTLQPAHHITSAQLITAPLSLPQPLSYTPFSHPHHSCTHLDCTPVAVPFDEHELRFEIRVPSGFQISNCGGDFWLDGGTPAEALPTTSGWRVDDNAVKRTLSADGRSCQVRMAVQRLWARFFIKSVLPNVIVVFVGLLGLWLDPTKPPLVGGRCSLLVTATLLVSNKLNQRTAIDQAQQSVAWNDLFALIQIGMLSMGDESGIRASSWGSDRDAPHGWGDGSRVRTQLGRQ